MMMSLRHRAVLVAVLIPCFSTGTVAVAEDWYAGRWNSTRYKDWNFRRHHPLTVALRVEVVDLDTDLPIRGAEVRLEGQFREDPKRAHDKPQLQDFVLTARSDANGIAVFGLSWQDEKVRSHDGNYIYTRDRFGKDDIFKVRAITIRTQGYRYAATAVDWFDPFAPPHDTNTDTYISDGWLDLIERTPRAKCVLIRPPDSFTDFGRQSLTNPVFFRKIRNKKYSKVFDREVRSNWDLNPLYHRSVNDTGPFMVLPLRFALARVFEEVRIQDERGKSNRGQHPAESGKRRSHARDSGQAKGPPQTESATGRHQEARRHHAGPTDAERAARNRDRDNAQRRREEQAAGERAERDRQERERRLAEEERKRRERADRQRAEKERAAKEHRLVEKAREHPLGLAVETLTSGTRRSMGLFPGTRGVVIMYVASSSPAAKAGLSAGIVIESVEHRSVSDASEFAARTDSKKPGDQFTIGIWRRDARRGWQRTNKIVALP